MVLHLEHDDPWVYGVLANQVWSVGNATKGSRQQGDYSQALVQPEQLVRRVPAGEAEELGQIAERPARGGRAGGGAAHAHRARRGAHEAGRALDQRRIRGAALALDQLLTRTRLGRPSVTVSSTR